MADPEELPRQAAEPRAERQVIAAEGDVDHVDAARALGHHHGAHRVRVPPRLAGAELQAPRPYGGANALREAMVPGEDGV